MITQLSKTGNEFMLLIDRAKQMTFKSYAPYSHFNVGAAVLLSDGTIVTGANQENAAFGECICAERVALLYATANYPDATPVAIAVAAKSGSEYTEVSVKPCGSCCQVLSEMEKRFGRPIKIVMYGTGEILLADSVADLLPLSFGNTLFQ